jgi:hypothetical protein
MITDRLVKQSETFVKAEGGSAGPATVTTSKTQCQELPPLPRCEEHPRRDLELYCRLCETVMCPTCKETSHSQCQNKWDEKRAQQSLTKEM